MSLDNSSDFLLNFSVSNVNGEEKHFYEFKSFRLDVAERQLLNNGVSVPLMPKVFDVLVFLVEHSGHLVEKDELMRTVWADTFVEEANIARIIHDLRKVLGEDKNGNKFIETVAKKGYRFVADVTEVSFGDAETARRGDAEMDVEEKSPQPNLKPKHTTRNILFAVGFVSVALLVFLLAFNRQPPTAPIDSIAVLPFENNTQDQNLDYLCDGITENIINTLSSLPGLHVLPRNTVFAYKGKVQDIYNIGKGLGVHSVLTGKIVRRGDKLVIQTELIDVEKKVQIWGEQYVYDSTDIFESQNYIAKEVVKNLRLKLSDPQKQKLAKSLTENPEAQKAYLNGLYFLNRANQQSQNWQNYFAQRRPLCEKSVEQFQQAIRLEPNYAQAYADLARAYLGLSDDQKAREAAQNAIRLDETTATAHWLLADILWQQDWNWTEAEKEFRRAIELNPSESGVARQRLASLLSAQGRHAEAIQEIELIEQQFPNDIIDDAWVGYIYKDARQYDRAIEKFKSVQKLRPDNTSSRLGLAEVYAYKGMYQEAIAEAKEAVKTNKGFSQAKIFLGMIYAMAGKNNEALKLLEEYKKQPKPRSSWIGSTYLHLGDKDRAFFWFDKACSERSGDLLNGIKVSPVWDKLRDDPRYDNLIRCFGLK